MAMPEVLAANLAVVVLNIFEWRIPASVWQVSTVRKFRRYWMVVQSSLWQSVGWTRLKRRAFAFALTLFLLFERCNSVFTTTTLFLIKFCNACPSFALNVVEYVSSYNCYQRHLTFILNIFFCVPHLTTFILFRLHLI